MKAAYLDDAEPAVVAHAIRDVLERRGALVSEHVSSHILFTARPSRATWERTGYVGIYQHLGEKEVEVRLILRARWPYRLLWSVALADVILALVTFLLNPSGTTWFVLAFLGGMALLLAALLHLNTLRSVREEEAAMMTEIEAALLAQRPGERFESREDRELHEAQAALEGEVERVRVERERKGAPKSVKPPAAAAKGVGSLLRFRKGPADAQPPAESAEEKRARLLARKAELEAQQEVERNRSP